MATTTDIPAFPQLISAGEVERGSHPQGNLGPSDTRANK